MSGHCFGSAAGTYFRNCGIEAGTVRRKISSTEKAGFLSRLERLIEPHGTQQAYGNFVGIADSTISDWRNDRGSLPSFEHLLRMRSRGGTDLNGLVCGDGDASLGDQLRQYGIAWLVSRGASLEDATGALHAGVDLLAGFQDLCEQRLQKLQAI